MPDTKKVPAAPLDLGSYIRLTMTHQAILHASVPDMKTVPGTANRGRADLLDVD